jgi:hypothetical protein
MAAITTDLEIFRLELGDDDPAARLFTDDEANYLLASSPTIAAAIVRAIDVLVLRYARQYDVTVDGQSFSRSQVASMLEKRAELLTSTSAQVVETAYVTRIDANSDDIGADDTRARRSSGNRSGSWEPCGYDLDDPDRDIPM